jgi:hypothetical protein
MAITDLRVRWPTIAIQPGLAECEEDHTLRRVSCCKSLASLLNPKENIAMKKNPKNQANAPQKKEDPATKKDAELGEGELNKVTGGIRKSGGDPGNAGAPYLRY